MKARTLSLATLFVLGLTQPAGAVTVDDFLAPGGIWWQSKSRIRVEKPVSLRQPTQWEAEEVILDAPVTTNGFPLHIQARRLVFGKEGRIQGFDRPAEDVPGEGPEHATAAATGAFPGGVGANGASGKEGLSGLSGMGAEGPLPAEVVVFAAQIVGKVAFIGTGQTGGKGGKGGPGQTGGAGGQGKTAIARVIFSGEKAGPGGAGGAYGKGGRGGKGGDGGVAVPFRLLSVLRPEVALKVELAEPGAGGDPGTPGKPGEGGAGGSGAAVKVLFLTSKEAPGDKGAQGAACAVNPGDPLYVSQCTEGPGPTGQKGTVPIAKWVETLGRENPFLPLSFEDFEKHRFEVTQLWYDFHWWRQFEALTRASLLLSQREESEKDDLVAALGTSFNHASVELITDRWRYSFIRPLEQELDKIRGKNPVLEKKIERALGVARPLFDSLTQGRKSGVFSRDALGGLASSTDKARSIRKVLSQESLTGCQVYSEKVLETKAFQEQAAFLNTHFLIPACLTAKRFLNEEEVQETIELATRYHLKATEALPGLVLEEGVKAELQGRTSWNGFPWGFTFLARSLANWLLPSAEAAPPDFVIISHKLSRPELTLDQLREFQPSPEASTIVGTLGVHRGYKGLKVSEITLKNFGTGLQSLVETILPREL